MNNFTVPAQKLWAKIASNVRVKILNKVWCGRCRDEVTILNLSGKVVSGDLVLEGRCDRCGGPVARLIESD